MNTAKRTIAFIEILLVLPAALFMTALFVRNIQPPIYEPARSATRLVDWFSARPFLCLDIFLIALPFTALIFGGVTILRSWRNDPALRRAAVELLTVVRAHVAALLIAGATIVAGGVLAIVAIHVITD